MKDNDLKSKTKKREFGTNLGSKLKGIKIQNKKESILGKDIKADKNLMEELKPLIDEGKCVIKNDVYYIVLRNSRGTYLRRDLEKSPRPEKKDHMNGDEGSPIK